MPGCVPGIGPHECGVSDTRSGLRSRRFTHHLAARSNLVPVRTRMPFIGFATLSGPASVDPHEYGFARGGIRAPPQVGSPAGRTRLHIHWIDGRRMRRWRNRKRICAVRIRKIADRIADSNVKQRQRPIVRHRLAPSRLIVPPSRLSGSLAPAAGRGRPVPLRGSSAGRSASRPSAESDR